MVPVAIYKLLFATVGLRHYWPYRVSGTAAHLLCVTLVFVYARPRVGGYLALLLAAVILFFGPGWPDFLWPFQAAWLIAITAGIGALLMLDRDDRAGRIVACVFVCIALASAGPGLAFGIGVGVELILRRRWRDMWIVVVPFSLYAVWWVGYQQASLVGNSLLLLPRFVLDAAAGAVSALTGLAKIDVTTDTGSYLDAGPALLVVAVGLAAWRVKRIGRLQPRVVTLIATAVAFWVITGLGRANVRVDGVTLAFTGDEGRYLYVGAVLIVLLAAELASGLAVPRGVSAIAGLVTVAIIVSNVGPLRDAGALLRSQAQITEAELGTLDMTRPIVRPTFISSGFTFFADVTASAYFAAEHDLGTPAATAGELAGFSESARVAADAQLIRIHQVAIQSVRRFPTLLASGAPPVDAFQSGTVTRRSGCVQWRASAEVPTSETGSIQLTVPASGIVLGASRGPANIAIRRFALQFEPLGTVEDGGVAVLRISPDRASQHWHVNVSSSGRVLACALG